MRLKFQVEKVLQMAIFEKVNTKLSFSRTDIHSIINRAVDSFALQCETRKASIKKDF